MQSLKIGDASPPDALLPEIGSEPLPCAPCTDVDRYEYVGSGTYRVPIADNDPKLQDAAISDVQEARLRVEKGMVALEYDLPMELTGIAQQVELKGTIPGKGAPMVLSGAAGNASCQIRETNKTAFALECTEELPGVTVDRVALKKLLEDRGLPMAAVANRLAVAEYFKEDPIGILRASLTFHQ